MTGDCRDCKDYRVCIGKDWFHFGEIRWCIYQVIWILAHAETLRAGQWPKAEDGSSDSNLGQRSVKTEASFVKPELIIGEVETRLERTGKQGELLVTQIEDERTISNLSTGAREVLMYVKGFRRKKIGFKKWLRRVYYRPKSVQKGQLAEVS